MPLKDPIARAEWNRANYAANRANRLAQAAVRYAAAPEKKRAYDASRYGPQRRDDVAAWKKAHPDKVNAQNSKRRAAQLQRVPLWADLKKIQQVYTEARTMTALLGEPWHVDHIVPLQGRLVSGLHVHTNLQILPGAENVKKHNRYQP